MTLQVTLPVAASALNALMDNAYNSVYAHILLAGDGVIGGGQFSFTDDALLVQVWDANNLQITWNVLTSALWAIKDFMNRIDEFKTMLSAVYDGANMVGRRWEGEGCEEGGGGMRGWGGGKWEMGMR